MKHVAVAAVAALGLSATVTPVAAAETFSECRERVEDTCALFVPRGSANWAACVENLLPFDCPQFFAAPIDTDRLWASLNEPH
jgi:hypothetical protein